MAHPRQNIRDEIYNILIAAQAALDSAAGAGFTVKVYNARILTIDDDNLPAVSVLYTENEGGEEINQEEQQPGDNNMEQRELIISIEVMTMRDTDKNAADQNDSICNVVENEIAKNITLNSKCESIELYRVRFRSSPEGKGSARLADNLFRARYKTIKAGA